MKLKKTNMSTQSLLGVKGFSRNGIQTNGHGEIVFYLVTPTNISVLSRVAVAQKVKHLMTLLTAQPDIEIVCIDARENFDDNKVYLDERYNDEPNGKIRELLLKQKTVKQQEHSRKKNKDGDKPKGHASGGSVMSESNLTPEEQKEIIIDAEGVIHDASVLGGA